MDLNLKAALYKSCVSFLEKRLNVIQHRLNELNDSLEAETKSSVGDKYETGRAMLHLEKDKQMRQLAVLLDYKKQLHRINPEIECDCVEQGALVETNQGVFYLSISAGKLTVEGNSYFAITLASPIGQLLFQKKVGEELEFRGRRYSIKNII
ncbi:MULTISPECIES: hypothetical protein [unclassified Aureispira]|uniref:hypothetical protein n=1 Tax=unclassified Aureispira TaxID=2649989 RepID=UPI000697C3A3|nr:MULTISPECIES: hypothetical protein [unclassified Aureispira]WMX16100.1 hypothetical protein QP953_06950 [Aureispira sp. CCB-E]